MKVNNKNTMLQKASLLTVLLSQTTFSTYASLNQNSNAQGSALKPQIELGSVSYGGNGCPAGSASEIKNPKFNRKILFKPFKYNLKTGKNKRRMVRKSCHLSIPVKVPQDISISFDHLNFKGSLVLKKGSSLRFSAEYFIAGKKGPKIKTTFNETKLKSFQISPKENAQELWSGCGESVNLRINTALLLRSKGTTEGFAALDSIQIGKDLKGALKWKKCQ